MAGAYKSIFFLPHHFWLSRKLKQLSGDWSGVGSRRKEHVEMSRKWVGNHARQRRDRETLHVFL